MSRVISHALGWRGYTATLTAPEATILSAIFAALVGVTGWYVSRRNADASEAERAQIEQRKDGMREVYRYVDRVYGALMKVASHLRGTDERHFTALAAANEPQLSIAGQAMVDDHEELKRLFTRFQEVESECHRLVGEADRERAARRSLRDVEEQFHGCLRELAQVGADIRREGDYLERG
jgi:hypothetical protein